MKILVIQGSPDAESYSHQLASAYADEARVAGHDVRMIDLATEDFDPVLRYGYRQHMEDENAPMRYQEDIAWRTVTSVLRARDCWKVRPQR